MSKVTKLLVFVPYNFNALDKAPKVRAFNMVRSFSRFADVTLISGRSYKRILKELAFSAKSYDYVYIEALGSRMYRSDFLFLETLKRKNIRIFPFIRDLYFLYENTLNKTLSNNIFNRYCRREFNWYLKNATAMLFPSQRMADTVKFPHKHLLPPAGDPGRCMDFELPEDKNVVFVGGISPKMGIDILVEAMRIVIKKYPEARCIIAGKGDREILNMYKNENFLSFVSVNYSQLDAVLGRAYLTVIPMPRIQHNDFAVPVKLYDYLSFGRPVVATNCTSMADYINSNQVGITTDDAPEAFAKGIIRMFEDREFAASCGKNAISLINKKDSWDHRARELLKIMEKYW